MEPSLRNRLTYGPLMLMGLMALLWLDWAVERWTGPWMRGHGYSRGIGGAGLIVLMLVFLPSAIHELAMLFAAERIQPYRSIAAVGSSLLAAHAFLTQFPWFARIAASTLAFIIVFVMLFAALRRAWSRQTHEAITHMAGTLLATLYFGGLTWFIIALRVKHSDQPGGFQGSTWAVIMILLAVKFTDVGAFFGGKAFGRHKLIPWLSPGKTWEGLGFGLLTAGLISMACAPWVTNLNWLKAGLFGILIGGIGQLGDLLESLMKRDAEVKDSGAIIPGFGGALDVIDSPLLAAPFAYLLFSLA